MTPQELDSLLASVRNILPSRLAASADKVSQREAELIVARNARHAMSVPDLLPDDPQLVKKVRSRSLELTELDRRKHPAGPQLDFQIATGEHPRSWEVMWVVLGVIAVLLVCFLIFGRHV